ncbi:SUN domain-containing protein 1/2 [Geosmithia morbida]|uniref:SUN domain-containing protein 1/2 n=1 Tax=Geosmithia morbida TaxID=1094350 RepID=A0A9P4YUH5_9HYPO|nr:SUN domain-containing protein 1/2 [Geosmithia morbida]KAF4123030.1 SUN domain-containing protein 1/2 [Geosmithia morbida]
MRLIKPQAATAVLHLTSSHRVANLRRRTQKAPTIQTYGVDEVLQVPRLPKLAGTPAARRQYTYGSAAEPPPSRPGRGGHQDQPLDLGNAVGNLLSREEVEDNPSSPGQMPPPPLPNHESSEDMRDDRSFITESDIYGDATIVSTTSGTSPIVNPGLPPRKAVQFKPFSNPHPALESVAEREESEEIHLPQLPQRHQPPQVGSLSPPRIQFSPNDHTSPRSEQQTPPKSLHSSPKRGVRLRRSPPDSWADVASHRTRPPVLDTSKHTGLSPRSVPDPGFFASNYSEADDAIQREIEASETEAVEEIEQESWRGRWLKINPISPFRAARQRAISQQRPEILQGGRGHSIQEVEEDDDQDSHSAHWWHSLNPRSHLDALWRFMDRLNDWFSGFFKLTIALFDLGQFLQLLGMGALITAISVIISQPGFGSSVRDSIETITSEVPRMPSMPDLKEYASLIGGYASSIVPRFGRSDDLGSLFDLGDEGLHEVEDYLKKYDQKLQNVVPKVVHMELKNGKPVVAPEFWYAMRDLLQNDDSFLTVDEKKGDVVLNPKHGWKAIAAKLASDPAFTSKFNLTMDGIERRINAKMTSFWDGWVKDNDDKISSTLGSALDRIKSAASERELSDVVKKIVKEQLHDEQTQGVVVTRGEFLRHLTNEFTVHRSEIRAELNELQPRIRGLMEDMAKLAASAKDDRRPAGMTREEVTILVNGLLRQALADTNLEAMAKGKIHAYWDADLKNQVNYFSQGAGAIVDAKLSSPTFDPYQKGMDPKDERYARGVVAARPRPPTEALKPWADEGDCWCAARKTNYRGNPHSVTLSVILGHEIIPEHVVIDHILPGATVDPGARPRDIEIYARIEDSAQRELIRDFGETRFPDQDPSTEDWNAMPADLGPRFVKIGQFRYEGAELHDGVYVHRLSNELAALRAETDQVVVRATSNYGANHHTCFYRVRLYGQRVDA